MGESWDNRQDYTQWRLAAEDMIVNQINSIGFYSDIQHSGRKENFASFSGGVGVKNNSVGFGSSIGVEKTSFLTSTIYII